MPRSPSTYSLPPGTTPQQPNTVISSSMFNAFADDVAQTFNTVQPVVYGGTGTNDLKLSDADFGIKDSVDPTKIIQFDAGTLPTATTRTLSVQNKNGTIALISDIESNNGPVNLSIVASVAANALTISIKGFDGNDPSSSNVVSIPFRSVTPSSGDIEVLTITSATSFVVSSGSTLGTTNAVPASLVVVGFNDAGTFRLGIINPANGKLVLDGIGSSTAEGGAGSADSAGVFYTSTAVSAKSYAVVGNIQITQAVAGTWVTAPSSVQTSDSSSVAIDTISSGLPVSVSRAILKYKGTAPRSIQGGSNISTVTPNGAGDFTIVMSEPMPDTNYTIAGSVGGSGVFGWRTFDDAMPRTTTSFRVTVYNSSGTQIDPATLELAVFA